MDPRLFDTLIRSLMAARSRRGALAALLGGTLGLPGLLDTAARKGKRKKKKKKKQKPKCSRPCGERCCRKGDRCADPATGTCVTGRGTCAAGANSCDAGGIECNPNSPITCFCNQTMEGETACVNQFQFASCSNCTTDAECAQPGYPPGMRCIDQSGGCYCENQGYTSLCAPPCPKPS